MEKIIKFASVWDASTWFIVAVTGICCSIAFFGEDTSVWSMVICAVMFVFVLVTLLGISYGIKGDKLLVYTFFIPREYPIEKIASIEPTKSVLSSPATSLSARLAIKFTDRGILRSVMPLIISPVRPDEFIRALLAVNPNIQVKQ